MKKLIVLVATLFFVVGVFAQKKTPFVLYDSKGKKVSYKKMIRVLAQNDMVLFGEYHNNSVVHWLQLELTKDLAEKKPLVLGAEMLEDIRGRHGECCRNVGDRDTGITMGAE